MRKTEMKRYEKLLVARKKALLQEMGIIMESHIATTIKDHVVCLGKPVEFYVTVRLVRGQRRVALVV